MCLKGRPREFIGKTARHASYMAALEHKTFSRISPVTLASLLSPVGSAPDGAPSTVTSPKCTVVTPLLRLSLLTRPLTRAAGLRYDE